MTTHTLAALQRYEDARTEASDAGSALWDVVNSSDRALIDARYRLALATEYKLKAAMILLGLDPVLPHPLRQREVSEQCDKAQISPFHRIRRMKKANAQH